MKVVRENPPKKFRTVVVRLAKDLADELDANAEKAGLKREPFIRAILQQVLADETFVLTIKD